MPRLIINDFSDVFKLTTVCQTKGARPNQQCREIQPVALPYVRASYRTTMFSVLLFSTIIANMNLAG